MEEQLKLAYFSRIAEVKTHTEFDPQTCQSFVCAHMVDKNGQTFDQFDIYSVNN